LKDRDGQLGRVIKLHSADDASPQNDDEEHFFYDVEWVMGGRSNQCRRTDLIWTCAELEGMTTNITHARAKRKPMDFMSETIQKDEKKKALAVVGKSTAISLAQKEAPPATKKRKLSQQTSSKKTASQPRKPAPSKSSSTTKTTVKPGTAKKRRIGETENASKQGGTTTSKTKPSSVTTTLPSTPSNKSAAIASAMQMGADLYEKHRREFERIFLRLQTKVDVFRHFGREQNIPEPFNELYTPTPMSPEKGDANDTTDSIATTTAVPIFDPNSQPPYNWEIIQRRMDHGRYVLDRVHKEETERNQLLAPYYKYMYQTHHKRVRPNKKKDAQHPNHRVVCPKGVHWELFRNDVVAMCDAALGRQAQQNTVPVPPPCMGENTAEGGGVEEEEDEDGDHGQRGSLSYTVRKIREALQSAVDRTGHRHEQEMAFLDDRYKFGLALESTKNTEAAMQSWRKIPFPERKYERLQADVLCAGLSTVDEKIAAFELKTKLPDSFIGQSYRYDDTGQSEAWMKSVVDETGFHHVRSTKASKKAPAEERMAALALAADEGVVRAQVSATMQSLLIAVQDRVMTECGVLRQPELRSANWIDEPVAAPSASTECSPLSKDVELLPEIVEQPVWGIDCYTRGNILNCLNIEFNPQTSLLFVEKWLLPAINACPDSLAHNISNAARILEGLPLEDVAVDGTEEVDSSKPTTATTKAWSESLLGRALLQKIAVSAPPWLSAAANQLRRAHASLGPDFFRVHPKGHGSVVLSPNLKANALVTFYRGELYPSWRWGEKMDAIDITQSRKDLKPYVPFSLWVFCSYSFDADAAFSHSVAPELYQIFTIWRWSDHKRTLGDMDYCLWMHPERRDMVPLCLIVALPHVKCGSLPAMGNFA
jgi:[histone H3]-lysine4 N-trimethyltransferase ATXR3